MSRRNRAEYRLSGGGRIALIGPPQPHPRWGFYLRIEAGNYVASLDGRALRSLARRLAKYLPECRPGSEGAKATKAEGGDR